MVNGELDYTGRGENKKASRERLTGFFVYGELLGEQSLNLSVS